VISTKSILTNNQNSELEPKLNSNNQKIEDLLAYSDSTFIPRKQCFRESLKTPIQDMNLGTEKVPQLIKVYSQMTKTKYKY